MLSVVWQQPNHLNGILTGYQVAITAPLPGLVVELEPNITATVLSDLPPFTDHMVTVTAMNSEGNITSVPATIKTGEISMFTSYKSIRMNALILHNNVYIKQLKVPRTFGGTVDEVAICTHACT